MLAIIPARGGSRGLPGKNVRPLGGIPLVAHSIRCALKTARVSRVVVSTDDEEIARLAVAEGVGVVARPRELATADALAMDAYLHAVDELEAQGVDGSAFVALLPTVPLRLPSDVDGAIAVFAAHAADSVISVTDSPVPPQWYRRIDEEGVLRSYFADGDAVSNRQAHDDAFVPNGAIYVFRTAVLRATRQYYTDKTWPFYMPRERSADIDNLLDFEWAEFLYSRRREGG